MGKINKLFMGVCTVLLLQGCLAGETGEYDINKVTSYFAEDVDKILEMKDGPSLVKRNGDVSVVISNPYISDESLTYNVERKTSLSGGKVARVEEVFELKADNYPESVKILIQIAPVLAKKFGEPIGPSTSKRYVRYDGIKEEFERAYYKPYKGFEVSLELYTRNLRHSPGRFSYEVCLVFQRM
jgi:hypothetical protein